MSESGKRYGLILSKKDTGKHVIQRPSVFNIDSDSDDSGQGERDWRRKTYQSAEKRDNKTKIEKALREDPNIYQYDEVYDEMKEKDTHTSSKKDEKKESRYIQSLKRNAERRKLENERRLERQVQKERKEEGEQFKDKETFVTSSYKKKLEEFQKMEEEEKRMDRLEEIGDVTKQRDISGFYRHLYASTVDKEQPSTSKNLQKKDEPEEKESGSREIQDKVSKPLENKTKQRQYRKRTKSASSKEEGEKTSSSGSSDERSDSEPYVKKPVKRERKSSFNEITSSVNNSTSSPKASTSAPELSENKDLSSNLKTVVPSEKEKSENDKSTTTTTPSENNKTESVSETKPSEENKITSTNDQKPIVNIWLKRTVGVKFDEALQRYLERKSKRRSGY